MSKLFLDFNKVKKSSYIRDFLTKINKILSKNQILKRFQNKKKMKMKMKADLCIFSTLWGGIISAKNKLYSKTLLPYGFRVIIYSHTSFINRIYLHQYLTLFACLPPNNKAVPFYFTLKVSKPGT